uniref:Uncharacterized protein n=1 Tax=Phaeomonas parva TaxID=124430 RepID=A0A7S1UIG8_9STRA|mmetsp:Transcript_6757/g.19448  ORF Transcript_6757/g.19448 Transcript_6757/m.19448 type:complete len:157 (+) Transcript_6757:925-1395(+)
MSTYNIAEMSGMMMEHWGEIAVPGSTVLHQVHTRDYTLNEDEFGHERIEFFPNFLSTAAFPIHGTDPCARYVSAGAANRTALDAFSLEMFIGLSSSRTRRELHIRRSLVSLAGEVGGVWGIITEGMRVALTAIAMGTALYLKMGRRNKIDPTVLEA